MSGALAMDWSDQRQASGGGGELPTAPAMSVALAAFARDDGIDATHRAGIVWDGAGAHTSMDLVVPDGIDLVALPPYAPDLQPAERRWPLLDEAIANRSVADLDGLTDVLVARCRTLRADRRQFEI
jgi:hypothetical protein